MINNCIATSYRLTILSYSRINNRCFGAFFADTKNPSPEPVEGSMYAKEVTALREPQGPRFDRLLCAASAKPPFGYAGDCCHLALSF